MAPNSNAFPSSRHLQQRKRKYQTDECDFSDDDSGFSPKSSSPSADDDRRAHHNELERRRRDHIKDHFSSLKNAIPLLEGEKSSRALILKRAVDYIQVLQAQLKEAKMEIEEQKRRNDQQFHQQLQTANTNSANNNTVSTGFGSLLNHHSSLPAPQLSLQQLPHQQQPQQQIFSLPSVSSAFGCMSNVAPVAATPVSSTSVIQNHHQNAAIAAYPTMSESFQQPSSPLAATTVPSTATNFSTDAAKTALLSQLLQLIQVPQNSLSPPQTLGATDFCSNNNSQQFFSFNDQRQLISAASFQL